MLLNASRMASGPKRVPGLYECVESNGTPNTVAAASPAAPPPPPGRVDPAISGLPLMYRSA